ncbi:MAG TPA: CopG family transcriptional regulator [Acetobacteraceae bacterium]|nr:CopG family transcriptional regulator [Acetobacteraceae bacterium]
MDTKVVTAEVSRDLAERVKQLAHSMDRSEGSIVQEALVSWVEIEQERHRLTREAMADIDAGRVVDHAVIQAWADSLGSDHPLPR